MIKECIIQSVFQQTASVSLLNNFATQPKTEFVLT